MMKKLITACIGLLCAGVAFGGPAKAADPLVLTYIKSNADYLDIEVAVRQGFFAKEGFAPQFAANSGSVQSTQMILTGAVQLAVAQPEALISAVAHGGKDLAIAFSPMNRVDWMLVGQKNMKSLSDLAGKTIGFSGLRVSEFWLTQQVLQDAGLPPNRYDSIQVGTSPAKYAALNNGSIGATILFQPLASQAILAGFSRLADLGDHPGYVPGLYIVNRGWAAQNDHGARLDRALSEAHAWLYDPKNRTGAEAILEDVSHVSQQAASNAYDLFFVQKKWYTKAGELDPQVLKIAAQTLITHHELQPDQSPPLSALVLPGVAGTPASPH